MNDKAKSHFKKYQLAYIIGGTAVGTFLITRSMSGQPLVSINLAGPVLNNSSNSVSSAAATAVAYAGRATKIVERLEDGKIWRSVGEAARELGVTPDVLSKVLNGHRDHLSGEHFRIIGQAVKDAAKTA